MVQVDGASMGNRSAGHRAGLEFGWMGACRKTTETFTAHALGVHNDCRGGDSHGVEFSFTRMRVKSLPSSTPAFLIESSKMNWMAGRRISARCNSCFPQSIEATI